MSLPICDSKSRLVCARPLSTWGVGSEVLNTPAVAGTVGKAPVVKVSGGFGQVGWSWVPTD